MPQPRPVRIRIRHRESGRTSEHQFVASPVRIGRNPLNDLPLPFPFVSSWHAVVRFDEGSARFFDLGSTNGTERDGRRIGAGESVDFETPVTIRIGDLDLVLDRALDGVDPRVLRAGTIDTDDLCPSDAGARQTRHAPLGFVHTMMATLRPAHDACRAAQAEFERRLRQAVEELPPHLRETAEQYARREFSERGDDQASSLALVRMLSEWVAPEVPAPRSVEEATHFLGRLRDVVQTFAQGMVELQNGLEQFGREMGVKAIKELTPLHVLGSPAGVLGYLLDWRHGGPHRLKEVAGIFADVMIHQVALLNGVAEGSRALLARLDPAEIERDATKGWGNRYRARWTAFLAHYRALSAEDRMVMEIVFGPEFARAYADVGGEEGARGIEDGEAVGA